MLFLVVLLLSFICQFYLPWWCIALIAAGAAFVFGKTGPHSFASAFFAVLLLWIGMSLWKTIPNENLLLDRVSDIFGLRPGIFARTLLVVVTGLVGGLSAGFPALAGYHWRRAFFSKAKA